MQVEVPEPNLLIHLSPLILSMDAGADDPPALLAYEVVQLAPWGVVFHFLESNNNHGIVVDHSTPRASYLRLGDAGGLPMDAFY